MARAEHWRRDAPTFYNFLGLDLTRADRPDVLGGIPGALMSRDLSSRAETHVLDIPPGWTGRTDSREASLEFFVLSGTLALAGETVSAGGYVHLPQGCGGEELSSRTGAKVLAFWNPNLPSFPYPYTRRRLLHTHETGWINSVPGAHGVMHKSLRLPDPTPETPESGFDGGPGGYLRFQFIAPEMIAEGEHVHHECWEEIILLQGDVLLVNEGQMTKGSVVSHPQEWYHAPFTSRGGGFPLATARLSRRDRPVLALSRTVAFRYRDGAYRLGRSPALRGAGGESGVPALARKRGRAVVGRRRSGQGNPVASRRARNRFGIPRKLDEKVLRMSVRRCTDSRNEPFHSREAAT
jgi:hypothetical protein